MPDARLFQEPEETPPGLDAIRTWLKKPRPRLHGLWIWVRWVLSRIPAAYRYLRKRWPAARKRIGQFAAAGEKIARGAVQVGYQTRQIGGGIIRATRALRGPDGKVSGVTARVRELGRKTRAFGGRLTEGGTGGAAVFAALGHLNRALRGNGQTGLGLLEPDPPETPPERLAAPEGREFPEPKAAHPERRPVPRPARKAELRPSATNSPAPPAPTEWETRLKDLPGIFVLRVKALGQRPRRTTLRPLILEICAAREWTTPAELSRWFSLNQRNLVGRHLRPMTKEGLLELRYPDQRSSRHQAYRTRGPDKGPGSEPDANVWGDTGG